MDDTLFKMQSVPLLCLDRSFSTTRRLRDALTLPFLLAFFLWERRRRKVLSGVGSARPVRRGSVMAKLSMPTRTRFAARRLKTRHRCLQKICMSTRLRRSSVWFLCSEKQARLSESPCSPRVSGISSRMPWRTGLQVSRKSPSFLSTRRRQSRQG